MGLSATGSSSRITACIALGARVHDSASLEGEKMRSLVRFTLIEAFASALLALSSFSESHADGVLDEIQLNSSTVQVVHNTTANTDVLNMSLNVTDLGEFGGCEGGDDDFIATGFSVTLFKGQCSQITGFVFSYTIPGYVAHHIGSATYGTYFALKPPGTVSSKIVALATPANTCGTWNITFQATGQDLEYLDTNQISLVLTDSADSGPFCFDVTAQIGNGIVKPHHGVRRA